MKMCKVEDGAVFADWAKLAAYRPEVDGVRDVSEALAFAARLVESCGYEIARHRPAAEAVSVLLLASKLEESAKRALTVCPCT